MTGDLQDELAVAPFIEKLIGRQTADRPYGPKTEAGEWAFQAAKAMKDKRLSTLDVVNSDCPVRFFKLTPYDPTR